MGSPIRTSPSGRRSRRSLPSCRSLSPSSSAKNAGTAFGSRPSSSRFPASPCWSRAADADYRPSRATPAIAVRALPLLRDPSPLPFDGMRLSLEHSSAAPPPMTAAEVRARGWTSVDVAFVTGAACVDHQSCALALLGQLLASAGSVVAILSQADWRSAEPFRVFGRPRLFFAVSAGNMDSMINHYTANKKVRNDDAYSPGGRIGRRPDRATLAY